MQVPVPTFTPERPLRIALVSPRGPLYRHKGGVWKKGLRYAPLTLTTLAALIPPEIPHTVTLVDEGLEEIDPELDADLVGLSAITGTAPRAYELAAHFQRRGIATVLGGGWVASGPAAADRLPRPVWPSGLRFEMREAAGEVQTPLTGQAASALRVGDRVWFRHTKAGELSEHVNTIHVVEGDEVVGEIPTYRGEGKAFL